MRLGIQFLFLTLIAVSQADAQSIGIGTATPDPSAILDVSGSKGLLLPRLTAAERDAIENPADGLTIFCTTDNAFYSYNGSWKMLVAISTNEVEGISIGYEAGLLAGILQLQPVKYDWKKESYPQFNFEDKRQIGFLAQELEKIFPETVTPAADGFYTIAYSELIPVVVQGIKEQQQQVETLKKRTIS